MVEYGTPCWCLEPRPVWPEGCECEECQDSEVAADERLCCECHD